MKKMLDCILLVLFLSSCYSTSNKSLAHQPLGNSENLKHASVGISVRDCGTGNEVINYNGEKSLHPASVQKILTTASALEILGPDSCFETRIAYSGSLKDGVLKGDLLILGGGDPSLGSSFFTKDQDFITDWIQAIKDAGIKTIEGSIVANVAAYSSECIPSKWVWEDIGNYYGAGTYGLSVYDNKYVVHFKSAKLGQQAQIAAIKPPIPELRINCLASGSRNNKDSAYIFGDPDSFDKTIRGTIPANKMDFSIQGAMPNPPLYLARHLTQQLLKNGVKVVSEARVSRIKNEAKVFYVHKSPSVSQIIKVINIASNNLYVEHLLWALSPDKEIRSKENGIKRIYQHLDNQNLNTGGLKMYDGSGLAPGNVINPSLITQLLYSMNSSTSSNEFLASLPVAGKNGTVSSFLKASPLNGKLRVKSGSMNGIRCYAGYIEKGEKLYSFTIQVNHYSGSSKTMIAQIEAYLETIYENNL